MIYKNKNTKLLKNRMIQGVNPTKRGIKKAINANDSIKNKTNNGITINDIVANSHKKLNINKKSILGKVTRNINKGSGESTMDNNHLEKKEEELEDKLDPNKKVVSKDPNKKIMFNGKLVSKQYLLLKSKNDKKAAEALALALKSGV